MTATISEQDLIARRLPLTGTFNVRDIGGYQTEDGRTTRWKTMLRGDALHEVDDEGREILTALGLRTALDLREQEERDHAPDALHDAVLLVSIPLFSYSDPSVTTLEPIDRTQIRSLEDTYQQLIRKRGPVLVVAIRELLRPEALPAIVHCTAGKDRTGIVIALMLSAIGVPDEVIAQDFSATGLFLNEDFVAGMLARRGVAPMADEARLRPLLSSAPELILGMLAEIRVEYGDVGSYLLHHGMTKEELDLLREVLTEVRLDGVEQNKETTHG